MKVDLELLTFIGVVLTLVISIFSIWDRIKPNFPVFSVYLKERDVLLIKNIGRKKGKIFNIEINKTSIDHFSIDRRDFPFILEKNGKIEYRIFRDKHTPNPLECTLTFKKIIWTTKKTFSL